MQKILGLQYIENYITIEEELELIKNIDNQSWLNDLKRRVQHYGYKYDYKSKKITNDLRIGKLPEWLLYHSKKLQEQSIFKKEPEQAIINEYKTGQGISKHIDCIPCFDNTICSLSLLSNCIMIFEKDNQKIEIFLKSRSLLIMTGEARYKWKHSIPARKKDMVNGSYNHRDRRISITFRNVLISN